MTRAPIRRNRARAVALAALASASLVYTSPGRADEPAANPAPPPNTDNSKKDAPLPAASETSAQREVGSPPPPSQTGDGFAFGSYGRVGIGSDGKGHEGYPVNVVSHGSRLEEPAYVELDLYYGGKVGDGRWRAVIAPAFGGDLFHLTGDFSSHFALRNAYVETEDVGAKGLRFWAGSRMYRGDDVYLFDYWPLDNLNTVGGGAGWRFGDNDVAVHVGMNRLDDPFQYQTEPAPPHGLGPAVDAVVVDRPRVISSFKYTRYLLKPGSLRGAKFSAYGELHYLPDGSRPIPEQERTEALPSDWGWVAGAQLGAWLRPYTFVNLFFRYAQGLAVYGDLNLPPTTEPARSFRNARELVGAISLNYESSRIGIMGAGYIRGYRDPDVQDLNPRDYVEGDVALRPQLYLTNWLHVATELSYQQRTYGGFDPYLNRVLSPRVFRFSVFPLIAPLGKGTYSRPMIYAIYTVSVINQDARDVLFDPTDVRYGGSTPGNQVVHYIGLGAEWWFQSSYR